MEDSRYKLLLSVCSGVILVDQFIKFLINETIPLHTSIALLPFFDLVHIRNRGAAFGFLNRSDIEWQFWLFLIVTLLSVGIILGLVRSAKQNQYALITCLGLILGGALGNLFDRIRFRAVVDFLDFYIDDWHWPAFNIADIAICCGGVCVCFFLLRNDILKSGQKAPQQKEES